MKATDLEDVSPHVLRHTAAVHLVDGGISFPKVRQFLGHSNPDITFKICGRYSQAHLRTAAANLSFIGLRSAAF